MEEANSLKSAFQTIILPNKDLSIENLTKNLDDLNPDAPFNEDDFNLWKKNELPLRKRNPVTIVTKHIIDNFKASNTNFKYDISMNPKRILTNPEEAKFNEGRDNEEHDLIVKVNDCITSPEKIEYIVLDLIGKGGSGQVFKCVRKNDQKEFAIKIIKNKKSYSCMAIRELKIIDLINKELQNIENHNIIKKYDHFVYKGHVCIILEILSNNLFELVARNRYQGLRLNTINYILKQILDAIYQVHKLNLIHCDLKPENILLNLDPEKSIIFKITDFGSACLVNNVVPLYVQSRHYRAPEVMIGANYSQEIDMWSVGCIAAELFLGTLFLPGSNEYDMLCRINSIIGEFPFNLIHESKKRDKFFYYDVEKNSYKLKSPEVYYKEFTGEKCAKSYEGPNIKSIEEMKSLHKPFNKSNQYENKLNSFIHFIKCLLCIDPSKRLTAKAALKHPFITNERFSEHSFLVPRESHFSHKFETTVIPENLKFYNSMIVKNNDINGYSYQSDINSSGFRPNVGNIPIKALKHFPYMMIPNNMNFNDSVIYHGSNLSTSQIINHNNTYMQTSFDQLNSSYRSTKYNNKSPVKKRNVCNNNQKNYNMTENNNLKHNYINNIENNSYYSNNMNANIPQNNTYTNKYENQFLKSEGNESTFYYNNDNSLNDSKLGNESFSGVNRNGRHRSNSDAYYCFNNHLSNNIKYTSNIFNNQSQNFYVTSSKFSKNSQKMPNKFERNKNDFTNNLQRIDSAQVLDEEESNK